MGRCTPRVWAGRSKLIFMSGQSKDCLWVCNVKMKNFLLGWKQGTFLRIFGFQGRSIEQFENFFMGFRVPMSLSVADIC